MCLLELNTMAEGCWCTSVRACSRQPERLVVLEFYSNVHQIQMCGGGGLACGSNASASLGANAATRPPAAPQLDPRSSICNMWRPEQRHIHHVKVSKDCCCFEGKSVSPQNSVQVLFLFKKQKIRSSISWGHFPKPPSERDIIRSALRKKKKQKKGEGENLCFPTVSCCSATLLREQQRDETQDSKTTSTPPLCCNFFFHSSSAFAVAVHPCRPRLTFRRPVRRTESKASHCISTKISPKFFLIDKMTHFETLQHIPLKR